ncbi:MAG: phosphonomutase-like enzyme, partial [Firmicutes bacterium]|nr:phosphonomutase-like enzyme [Bacillota bacterium]
DSDLVIIARTDSRTLFGIEEAIRRGKAYEAAGADVLFIESPESMEEMKLITSSFSVPVLANMVEGGRTPMMNNQKLQEIGYNLVIYPTASTYITAYAMTKLMNELKAQGTTEGMINEMLPFAEFNELIGLTEIRAIENMYLPKE